MGKFSFLFILIVVFALFYPAFGVYFSHDDFFMFKVSQTDGSFQQFVNLFGFHPFSERGIAFYRPIFRELLYNSYYSFFGLNHLPFRIFSLFIHFINIWLVFTLVKTFFQKNNLAFFVALFFGISTPNVAILYYLAGGIEASGATAFALLTIIFFLKFLKSKKHSFAILSFISYILALGAHEIAALTPILLAGILLVFNPVKKALPKVFTLWPYFLVLCIYLYLDIYAIGFSTQEKQYQLVLSIKTLFNSFIWYLGWGLGLPEMLIDFIGPLLKLNPNLMRYWGNFFVAIFTSFALIVLILGFNIIKLLLGNRVFFKDKKFWFFVFWFLITLLPMLFLPAHKSSYYLALSLPALWIVVGLLIFVGPRILIILFIISAFILSATGANLAITTYPAAVRGKLAQKIIKEITTTYPTLPKGAILYFKNDPNYPNLTPEWGGSSRQISFILNGSDALALLYKDPTIKAYYEDLNQPLPGGKIYEITLKIL